MGRFLRNVCLILLMLAMFLLLGSGRKVNQDAGVSEAERAARCIGGIIPKGEQQEWQNAAAQRPLWLLRVTSSSVVR